MFRMGPARLLIGTAVGCLALALALRAGHADRLLFLAINDAAWRWLPPGLASCATLLGNGLAAAMLLAPTLLSSARRLAAALMATPIALLLSRLPKVLIDSPRPGAVLDPASIHVEGIRLAGHNSLPSGHTLTAFVVVAVLLAGDRGRPLRLPAALGVWLIGAAVAVSRVAVGAHWPSDTLAGAALGLLAGVAGVHLEQRWQLGARRAARPLLALALLGCAAALARSDTGYPLAQPLQWALAALGAAAAALALWRFLAIRRTAARPPA